jgi:hypothetical protein
VLQYTQAIVPWAYRSLKLSLLVLHYIREDAWGHDKMKCLAQCALLVLLSCQAACTLGKTAAQMPCHADMVQDTSSGPLLSLSSGQTYQIYPTDIRSTLFWLPLDKLTVCPIGGSGVQITNLTAKTKPIRALQIFNLGNYIWPLGS